MPNKKKLKHSLEHQEALRVQRRNDERRRKLSIAGVDVRPGTAQDARTFDVIGLGSSLRASINHYQQCFPKTADRSNSRLIAWSKFDELQNRVHAGDIPSPRFEPSVDRSGLPDVADQKLAAKGEDAEIRTFLGHYMHQLLVDVVFWQKSFRQLAGGETSSIEAQRVVAGTFRIALDQAAAFFGVSEDNTKASEANWAIRRRERATTTGD
jgi:hypothetical protein